MPVELQDMPLLVLADAAYVFVDEAPGVAVNDVPKISLVLQLAHVEFGEFAAERDRQLLLASRRVGRVHAHEDSEVCMLLGLDYVSSLIQ